jgi:hypothetical protein
MSESGQTLREVLEELSGCNPTRLTFAAFEARKSEEALRRAQEASEGEKQRSREAKETPERIRQQGLIVTESTNRTVFTNSHSPRRYWQRTKITGVDPLSEPGSARLLRQRVRGNTSTSRELAVGIRSDDPYRSGQYWQRTKITGVDQFKVTGNKTLRAQEKQVSSVLGNLTESSLVSTQGK